MATPTSAAAGPDGAALLRLMTWFSPAFPIGAFGFSHGLETAIREQRVGDAGGLAEWIAGLVEFGSGWTDAVLFKLAWAATSEPELAELAELAAALAPSLERHRETLQLGAAFLKAAGAWSSSAVEGERRLALTPYPVAAGAACAAAAIPLTAALTAFLHAFAANLVSVAIRAAPLGHSAGVAVMAALEPILVDTVRRAAAAGADDLGGCAILSDIAAMRHETLPGRLFIS